MPIEALILSHAPYAKEKCQKCGERFPEFMRGQVQRSKRFLGIGPRRRYCAVICHACKEIIGWESPLDYYNESELEGIVRNRRMELGDRNA